MNHPGLSKRMQARLWAAALPDDGGAGGEGAGTGGAGGGSSAGDSGTPGKAFTQDDVNRMTTEARDRGKRQAIQEIATQFGMSPEQAAAKLKEMTDAETARLTEVEKREKAATDKEAAAVQREAAASERERAAAIRSALAEAGVAGKDEMGDAAILVRGSLDATADDAAILAEVDKLKTRRPELFGVKTSAGSPAPSSDPGKSPPAGGGAKLTATQRAEANLKRFGLKKEPAKTT